MPNHFWSFPSTGPFLCRLSAALHYAETLRYTRLVTLLTEIQDYYLNSLGSIEIDIIQFVCGRNGWD